MGYDEAEPGEKGDPGQLGSAASRLKLNLLKWGLPVLGLGLCLIVGRPVAGAPTHIMNSGMTVICEATGPRGVLVLAHGGNLHWNENVVSTLKTISDTRPMVVHFGMGIQDASALEESVQALEALGVNEVLAVPLFVSSHSLIIRQLKFLLGLGDISPFDTGLLPLEIPGLTIRMTSALDAAPEVVEVLKDRVHEISQEPGRETVVFVAHGPVEDADHGRWVEMMNVLHAQLAETLESKNIYFTTLRDDAAEEVRQEAVRGLRELVEQSAQEGDVLVVPFLISAGGIEGKIRTHLKGLSYKFNEQGLIPHPVINRWISRQIETGFSRQHAQGLTELQQGGLSHE